MNPLLRNRITIRLFVRGLNALIKAVVFDVDGTLYDETYPKVKAELLTAEFISDKSCVNVEDVYNTFREVKAQITSEYGGRPERNDRRIWYEETLRRLSVTNISKEEASTYYWQVVYSSIEPYIDLLYVLPNSPESINYSPYLMNCRKYTGKKSNILGWRDSLLTPYLQRRQGRPNPAGNCLIMPLR